MGDVIRPYQGYFSVIVPENLKKLINGDILKLRDAVTEFSEFLGRYGETASEVHSPFCNDDDITYWLYYHSLSFSFPDEKLVVGIKTASEKMFREIQQGIVNGKFKIVLRGVAKISKNDVEGIDKEIKDIWIQKIEGYWENVLHSSSPDVRLVVDVNNKKIVDKFLNRVDEQLGNKPKVVKISDLPTVIGPTDDDDYLVIDEDEDEDEYLYEKYNLKDWYENWSNKNLYDILNHIENKKYLDKKKKDF